MPGRFLLPKNLKRDGCFEVLRLAGIENLLGERDSLLSLELAKRGLPDEKHLKPGDVGTPTIGHECVDEDARARPESRKQGSKASRTQVVRNVPAWPQFSPSFINIRINHPSRRCQSGGTQ
jgi:hypothetical protein